MPNTRGLGFWLKQLKSDTEASQSNLSTVANIDTDESLDGADSTYEADRGIEFSTGKSLSEALLFAEHVVYKNCF